MTSANLLSFSIFICCFTTAWFIRELLPCAEYLKKSSKCSSNPKTIADSFILPFESSFRLECGEVCTENENSVALKHLWHFQPSHEFKVYNLPGKQTKNYTVTENGTLEIEHITRNGVFYCHQNGTIYALYSISTVGTKFLKPVFGNGSFLNQNISFSDGITGQLSTVKKFQTSCSTIGQVGINRSIYQHEVSLYPTNVEKKDSAEIKIVRFKSISMFDFEVVDWNLMRSLSTPNLPSEAVVYQYTFCKVYSPEDNKSNAEKFTEQQITARNQIFRTKFKNIGKSALLSCAFKGVKEYRWKKVSLSNGDRSQWLSTLFLSKNTGDRMRIDFLCNLHFETLHMDDYKYRYVCYDGDQPIVSFAFKLDIAFNSLVDLLPQPDVMTIICVALSTIIIFWTILSSPDISSKL